MPHKLILIRDVSQKECPWLERDFQKEDIVFECLEYTYGCISNIGIACTKDSEGTYPFFELPKDSVKITE